MYRVRITISICLLAFTSACATGYRPSTQAYDAVDALRDVEYASQYMINEFNPCRKPQASKSDSYSAEIKLDRKGEIIPQARVRTSAKC